MSHQSQFPDWLNGLSASGLRLDLPELRLGAGYALTITLAQHADLGDYVSGVFSMQAKASPGAETALATFDIERTGTTGGVTSVDINLDVAGQSGLVVSAESGVSEVVYDILYTLSGVDPFLVAGGRIPLLAGVTE